MAKTIALTNHKGGCGKTTSTASIGAALAQMGYSCLLVDLDPQQNLTQSLGIDPSTASGDVYTALELGKPLQPITAAPLLDLVPAKRDLAGMEYELANRDRRTLAALLEPLQTKYKYILLDCPPSLGLLTLNALTAADAACIPLQAQYLALQGVGSIVDIVADVKQNLNPTLQLAGVFLTQYDSRKVLHRNVAELAEQMLGQLLCNTKVRDNVALAEAPTAGQTIYQYAPKSKGAEDYMALAKELHKRIQQLARQQA